MEQIKCLYLEHDEEAFNRYSKPIRSRWRRIFGSDLEFDRVPTIEEAFEKLCLPDGTYQIFISDLLFPPVHDPNAPFDKHEPRGLEAITEAGKKQKLLVIGLSIGSTESHPGLRNRSLHKGAHLFKYVREIFDPDGSGIVSFCQEIHHHLLQLEIIQDQIKLEYDSYDPTISYIIHEVGEGVLKSLYSSVVGDEVNARELHVTHLAPGMSGAFVLKITATEPQRPCAHHLLKISRSKERLKSEITNYPRPGTYSSRLLVNYLSYDPSHVAQVGEWHAIGARFEIDTMPMLEWLREADRGSDVGELMRSIFLNGGLRNGYSDIAHPDNPQPVVKALNPNLSRQSRICVALEELDAVVRAPSLGGDKEWKGKADALRRYLKSQQIGKIGAEETPRKSVMYQCHGDLHLRNVLVTKMKPYVAIIIDTSDFGVYHWASDYARLLVDLILSGYDRGIPSYQWKRIAHWRKIAEAVIRLQQLPSESGDDLTEDQEESSDNQITRATMTWMIENIGDVCTLVADKKEPQRKLWELQLAFSVEFMRGSYRLDVTAPKQVLALQAAYDAISAAESSFEKVRDAGLI